MKFIVNGSFQVLLIFTVPFIINLFKEFYLKIEIKSAYFNIAII